MVNRGSDLISKALAGSVSAPKQPDAADALSQIIQQAMDKIFKEWLDGISLATEKGGDGERLEGETEHKEGEIERPEVDLLERWLNPFEDLRSGDQEQDQPSTQHTRSSTRDEAVTEKQDGITLTSTTAHQHRAQREWQSLEVLVRQAG